MNVSSVSTTSPALPAASARAADGDYKTKGVGHEVKDADGDYKSTQAAPTVPVASTVTAATSSSNAVRGALIGLSKGGS